MANTELTTFSITQDDTRRIVATTTKKAARDAFGISDWIARKHMSPTTDEVEVRVATADPGTVIEATAAADGTFDFEPESNVVQMPKVRASRRPQGKTCATNFGEILDNLQLAFINESDIGVTTCQSLARQLQRGGLLARGGYVADGEDALDQATSQIWERINQDLNDGLLENGRLDRSMKNPVVQWSQSEHYQAARACIERVYLVTDRIDDEDTRILAWRCAMAYLVGRFVVENFIVPTERLVDLWITKHGYPSTRRTAA